MGTILADKKNYHYAKGTPNVIYSITEDTVVAGIKFYYQNFKGSAYTFEYSVEKFVYDDLDDTWRKTSDMENIKTESCNGEAGCVDGEK